MADEVMWYVSYADGKWTVEEEQDATEKDFCVAANIGIFDGPEVSGFVLASCENEATQKACKALMDIFSAANRAPLPVRFDD